MPREGCRGPEGRRGRGDAAPGGGGLPLSTARGYVAALVALGIAGVLVLLGCARPWAVVTPAPGGVPLPARSLTGAELAPVAPAMGVVLLAGCVAVVAARSWLRRAVGVVLAAASVGVLVAVAGVVGDAASAAVRVVGAGSAPGVTTSSWWIVTVAGGLLGVVAAVAVVVRGAAWPSLSGRYDRPGTGPRGASSSASGTDPAPPRPAELWDALDRGEDPTA